MEPNYLEEGQFEPVDQSTEIIRCDNTDIVSIDIKNPTLHSPSAEFDLYFYQTKETLADPEIYKSFLKNAETRFRRCKEYKMYKAYLMSLGMDHCQRMGNIESDDTVDIELHHNVIGLFEMCILICEHVLNTVGFISTFDLIQLLIYEHQDNRVGVVFLSTTAHEIFTNDQEGYIPPDMTFGRWWELLYKYRFGITFELANKVNKYISKFQKQLPISIDVTQQEQILNFAYYNEYGTPKNECIPGLPVISDNNTEVVNYEYY